MEAKAVGILKKLSRTKPALNQDVLQQAVLYYCPIMQKPETVFHPLLPRILFTDPIA
jgi:hypothetical protein